MHGDCFHCVYQKRHTRKDNEMTKIMTPEALLSYEHLFQPMAPEGSGAEPQYSACLVFSKETDLGDLKNELEILDNKVTTLARDLRVTDEKLNTLDGSVNSLNSSVNSLDGTVKSLDGTMSKMDDRITKLKKQVDALPTPE